MPQFGRKEDNMQTEGGKDYQIGLTRVMVCQTKKGGLNTEPDSTQHRTCCSNQEDVNYLPMKESHDDALQHCLANMELLHNCALWTSESFIEHGWTSPG